MAGSRYLYITEGRVFGGGPGDPAPALLVEDKPGVWRSLTGAELMTLHERYPHFIASTRRRADADDWSWAR